MANDKVSTSFITSADMRARISTYARIRQKTMADAINDCLELYLGQGSEFDDQLQNDELYMRTYNGERSRYGLKPLKHNLLKANLSSMLNDNSIEDIITTLKELKHNGNH